MCEGACALHLSTGSALDSNSRMYGVFLVVVIATPQGLLRGSREFMHSLKTLGATRALQGCS